MINVLLPSLGKSVFFKDIYFPKPLLEINGMTMIEAVYRNYTSLAGRRFIYAFSKTDCQQFHLDESVKLLDDSSKVVIMKAPTAGALCTSLFCIDHIDSDEPLIISNSDQIIDVDFNDVVDCFQKKNSDAGVITFNDIHPRWSYIKVNENGYGIEVAEKRPLSNNAIAGFYYYRKGSDFVEAAKRALLKQSSTDGVYYISASLNEMILMGKQIDVYRIDKSQYHPFYSPEKIRDYERIRIL